MLALIAVLTIPIGIFGWNAHKGTINWQGAIGGTLTVSILLLAGFSLARWSSMRDQEYWSGRITEKTTGSEHCCHCRQECDTCTRRDSSGNTSRYSCNCREVCNHSRDYWWSLEFSTGDSVPISRCEPNSWAEPPAWTNAQVGEPGVVPHAYTNYLLADPDSVYRQSAAAEMPTPAYPALYEYYKVDRAIDMGTSMPLGAWNQALNQMNADLGGKKQVNIILIATPNPDPIFADSVEHNWLYGKKNDLIIVVGVGAPDKDTIAWARVVTISNVEDLKIALRDGLQGKSLSDVEGTAQLIRKEIEEKFNRTPMANFEYLASAAKPTFWGTIGLFVEAIVASMIGLVYLQGRASRTSRFDRRW